MPPGPRVAKAHVASRGPGVIVRGAADERVVQPARPRTCARDEHRASKLGHPASSQKLLLAPGVPPHRSGWLAASARVARVRSCFPGCSNPCPPRPPAPPCSFGFLAAIDAWRRTVCRSCDPLHLRSQDVCASLACSPVVMKATPLLAASTSRQLRVPAAHNWRWRPAVGAA